MSAPESTMNGAQKRAARLRADKLRADAAFFREISREWGRAAKRALPERIESERAFERRDALAAAAERAEKEAADLEASAGAR